MADIIRFFLQFSAQIKLYHWQSMTYSRHVASDSLFNSILPLIDEFIEVYQGKNQRIMVPKDTSLPLFNLTDSNILEYLESFKSFLVEDIPVVLDNMTNSDLLNIRDEMLGLINKTIYLFSFTD